MEACLVEDHRLQLLHSSHSCDWRTPLSLYAALATVWHFDLDLAASAESSLVFDEQGSYYLGPDHPQVHLRDALAVDWHTQGRVGFLNPPYSLSLYSEGLKEGLDRADLQWLLIENWAKKAWLESLQGFTTIGVFPYAAQTEWFRTYVMGHTTIANGPVIWGAHAALDYWRLPHRVSYLRGDGEPAANANVNTCVVIWGPNPGFVGPWVPSGRYWSYR